MSYDQLFRSRPAPAEQPPADASVSPLAPYVLDQMPADLAAVRAGDMSYLELQDKQAGVLDEHAQAIADIDDPTNAAVTQMDLGFMLGSYLPRGEQAFDDLPPQLMGLLQGQADRFRLPSRLNYELVIDENTREGTRIGRMRTFLDGPAADSERDFYRGHYMAEPHIKEAAYNLHAIVEDPARPDATPLIDEAREHMGITKEFMRAYLRLPIKDFALMRPYLGKYPDGKRNASGAFMPGVQMAELSLRTPTEEHNEFLSQAMSYFPGWSQSVLREWQALSTRGRNIAELLESGELALDEARDVALTGLFNNFIGFRMAHTAATYRQIPEAFGGSKPLSRKQLLEFGEPDILEDGAKGTADFNVPNILGGSTYRLLDALRRLKELPHSPFSRPPQQQ